MSGFVYIWFDKKYTRYYVGSHWGSEKDGYICSSDSMREAYRRRKEDFKRRIISIITSDRKDLLVEEQRYLDMIKLEEFGKKYYNINPKVNMMFWWINEETRKQVIIKLKEKRAFQIFSEETKKKMSISGKGKHNYWKGKKQSKETNLKRSLALKGIPGTWLGKTFSEEHKENMKKAWVIRKTNNEIA